MQKRFWKYLETKTYLDGSEMKISFEVKVKRYKEVKKIEGAKVWKFFQEKQIWTFSLWCSSFEDALKP